MLVDPKTTVLNAISHHICVFLETVISSQTKS